VNPWIVVLILLGEVAVALPISWFIWWRHPKPKHTSEVIVHCRDEASFAGVELRRDSSGILLGAARSLPDEGPPVPMIGDLWIPASNVRAVQIVPGLEALREPQPRAGRPPTITPERGRGIRRA
jgi:hypothetical protein